jgi:hypothetical protein
VDSKFEHAKEVRQKLRFQQQQLPEETAGMLIAGGDTMFTSFENNSASTMWIGRGASSSASSTSFVGQAPADIRSVDTLNKNCNTSSMYNPNSLPLRDEFPSPLVEDDKELSAQWTKVQHDLQIKSTSTMIYVLTVGQLMEDARRQWINAAWIGVDEPRQISKTNAIDLQRVEELASPPMQLLNILCSSETGTENRRKRARLADASSNYNLDAKEGSILKANEQWNDANFLGSMDDSMSITVERVLHAAALATAAGACTSAGSTPSIGKMSNYNGKCETLLPQTIMATNDNPAISATVTRRRIIPTIVI